MRLRVRTLKRIVREALESGPELQDLLDAWEGHFINDSSREEQLQFAADVAQFPEVFTVGNDDVDVYRFITLSPEQTQDMNLTKTWQPYQVQTRDKSWAVKGSEVLHAMMTGRNRSEITAVIKSNAGSGRWLLPGPEYEDHASIPPGEAICLEPPTTAQIKVL